MKNTLAFLAGVILAVSVSTFAYGNESFWLYGFDKYTAKEQQLMMHYTVIRSATHPTEDRKNALMYAEYLLEDIKKKGLNPENF